MENKLTTDQLSEIHKEATLLRSIYAYHLKEHSWKGHAGNVLGTGIGSSIDFQDHRPYVPGDDPRYIDWQAYARSRSYILKQYREEITPRFESYFDISPSMFFQENKLRRSPGTFYFCIECALQNGASLRCYAVSGLQTYLLEVDRLLAHEFELLQPDEHFQPAISLGQLNLRYGSLRILVSDLLFPGEPKDFINDLYAAKGRAVILAPFLKAESEPNWDGNIHFTDCETGEKQIQRVSQGIIGKYRDSYLRHFDCWREACTRVGATFARVSADYKLEDALIEEALPLGIVEVWN